MLQVDLTDGNRHQNGLMTESIMADEPEDPDTAADRLEAALERIARLASARPPSNMPDPPDDALSVPDIAERLDHLIGRLRSALDHGDRNQPAGDPDGGDTLPTKAD